MSDIVNLRPSHGRQIVDFVVLLAVEYGPGGIILLFEKFIALALYASFILALKVSVKCSLRAMDVYTIIL